MTTLLKGKGVFDLSDSDNHVGSLFSLDDLIVILEIDDDKKSDFCQAMVRLKLLKNDGYVDESGKNGANPAMETLRKAPDKGS